MAKTILEQHGENVRPGPFHADASAAPALPAQRPVRLIAFYLPQFHAIPENDEWWGPGFTEWTNVTRSLPRFEGHYQPRLPADLGFYDLRDPDVLRRQADLARRFGLEGFCFHHYWFGGRRLLETPLNNLLANRDIALPFCVNWANENWSRRWDGSERSILMAQSHSSEDDIAFARSLEPLFDDERYIRIDGRPLLMLYRPSLLPDAAATVRRWRDHFARRGDNPFIVIAQVFKDHDPRPYGMDAAAGFPPHRARDNVPPIRAGKLYDPQLETYLVSYDDIARDGIDYRPKDFRLFPGVCPDWDNDARSPGRGLALVGSTPHKYGLWLETVSRWIAKEAPPQERIVFINAWNEWAEGAHLEPDRHHGHAYLVETARALARIVADPNGAVAETAFGPGTQRASLPKRALRRGARKAAGAADRVAGFLRSI
ncbi:MAG: hypothetical protein QOH81_814 [Sphingomonadales bacterium]|jgi:hypothetical protein|nr:hypothetical protein [Sphingomonadales bacterium]